MRARVGALADAAEATAYLAQLSGRLGLPAVDAVRTGVGPIVDALLGG